jgi:two-component system chemotaxis sensor kinase CheA
MDENKSETTVNNKSAESASPPDIIDKKDEKSIILASVEEGLLFLNPDFEIEDEYSDALEQIIDQKVVAGQNFLDILSNRVPENVINNTVEFLNLLFRADIEPDTLEELNPLVRVEFHFENRWGLWTSSKFLSFRFRRIEQDKKIIRVVCTVKDITKSETLSKKIEEIEETTNKQMEWLVNILRVAPPLLKEFMDVSEMELNQIDTELKSFKGGEDCRPVLNKIIKSLHQLSNNASLLNLGFITDKLNQFESEVQKLKVIEDISGSDFVPAVIQLGEMRQMLKDVSSLMKRFKPYSNTLRPTRRYEGRLLLRTLSNLIQNLSKQLDKQVDFTASNFDVSLIPYSHQQIVREFLIILVRFSIYYGIETPDERKSNNKDPVGLLEIETFSSRGQCGFKLRHDGRLVRIERLLQKTMESVETRSHRDHPFGNNQIGSEVVRLLFMPSLATPTLTEAEYIKEIFGEMEMAKKKLKMHRGKIKITFTSENFCEYTISLPVK